MDKRTAIYRRVSSTDQSLASQGPELEAWARANALDALWFDDQATGRTMERPGLENMMTDVRAGRIDRVVVWRLDRLGRTVKGLVTLLEELQTLNVVFVSLRDGIDITTAAGEMMFTVLAAFARFETRIRGERVKAGIAKAKADGKRWGGSKKGQLKKATKAKIREIERLFAAGVGKAGIARAVGLSRPTVQKLLGKDAKANGRDASA